jgi:hypothetical protein
MKLVSELNLSKSQTIDYDPLVSLTTLFFENDYSYVFVSSISNETKPLRSLL